MVSVSALHRFSQEADCPETCLSICHYRASENMPATVFIHSFGAESEDDPIPQPRLIAVLMQSAVVRSMAWKPGHLGKLAIACGGSAVYFWELVSEVSEDEDENIIETRRQIAEAVPVPIGKPLLVLPLACSTGMFTLVFATYFQVTFRRRRSSGRPTEASFFSWARKRSAARSKRWTKRRAIYRWTGKMTIVSPRAFRAHVQYLYLYPYRGNG